MKTIFFNLKPPLGSYGGGSFFVKNFSNYLIDNNYRVVYELVSDIDILFVIDPRSGQHKKYDIDDILNYKKKNKKSKMLYRVNECDIKREISINIEPLLVNTILAVDEVIFVSKWLQDYYISKYNLVLKSYSNIINGVNPFFFYNQNQLAPKRIEKIKLVTHHFSNNYLKGFHVYNELDKLLPQFENIEFTYIGNYINNYKPKNIKLKPLISGKELGDELRKHNIYITATQNEPGAMHYLEAMSCGLPILYCVGGGGVNEVCKNSGEEFNNLNDFFIKLQKIINNYDKYVEKIDYNFLSSERCSKEYENLIKVIL